MDVWVNCGMWWLVVLYPLSVTAVETWRPYPSPSFLPRTHLHPTPTHPQTLTGVPIHSTPHTPHTHTPMPPGVPPPRGPGGVCAGCGPELPQGALPGAGHPALAPPQGGLRGGGHTGGAGWAGGRGGSEGRTARGLGAEERRGCWRVGAEEAAREGPSVVAPLKGFLHGGGHTGERGRG